MCGVLLLTSGTVVHDSPHAQSVTQSKVTPLVVNLHVSEYPEPLTMLGMYKYHVLINGRIVGMTDAQAAQLLTRYNITPYTPEQFYQLGLDNQIWARTGDNPSQNNNVASRRR